MGTTFYVLFRFVVAMLVLCGLLYVRDALRLLSREGPARWGVSAAVVWACIALFPNIMLFVAGFSGYIPLRSIPEGPAIMLQMWNLSILVYGLLRMTSKGLRCLRSGFRHVRAPRPAGPATPASLPPAGAKRRPALARLKILSVPTLTLLLTGYALLSRYDCRVHTLALDLPEVPASAAPIRIVQISDLHMGQFFTVDQCRFYLNRVRELNPDLVFITGDIINSDNAFFQGALPSLAALAGRVPVFSCMGNHDYIDNPKEFAALSRQAGICLLVNNHRVVNVRGVTVLVAGVDYSYRRKFFPINLEATYKKVRREAVSILLAHNPVNFDYTGGLGIDLVLSGHTHGGQFVFHAGTCSGSVIDPFVPYSRGHYRRGREHLYVNSGLGSWLPLRLNCAPEITVVELR